MVTRFISKGKGRKRKAIPITPKKKGVSVRSVSLEPLAIQKINKKTIKTLKTTGEPANFSSSLNKLVISSRLKRDSNKTVWKVVLEDPSEESGTRTHIITLGRQATEEDVRNQLLRMQENGRFMYHPQDLQFPNLHSIERKARDTDSGEIPPEKIFDKNRLTKHDGRYFLIAEGYPDTLAVDEYEKVNDNLFKLKRTILFSQSGEETEELLRVTGGGKKFKALGGVFGLADEKKFLEGLDSSGALQESNFG